MRGKGVSFFDYISLFADRRRRSLPSALCRLTEQPTVRIDDSGTRQQEVTYRAVNHASFEGMRGSATPFSAREGGERSVVCLLHIYVHVRICRLIFAAASTRVPLVSFITRGFLSSSLFVFFLFVRFFGENLPMKAFSVKERKHRGLEKESLELKWRSRSRTVSMDISS